MEYTVVGVARLLCPHPIAIRSLATPATVSVLIAAVRLTKLAFAINESILPKMVSFNLLPYAPLTHYQCPPYKVHYQVVPAKQFSSLMLVLAE